MRHLCFLLVLAASLASCGSDPGTDEFVESLRETRPELSNADARCIVEDLQQTYSDNDLASLIDESTDSNADQQRFADRQLAAVRNCGLEDQFSADLANEFARVNDLTAEVAQCAVGSLQERFGFWELTDLLASDDLEDRFQRRQFEAIFSCGDRTSVVEQLRPQMIDQGVAEASATCVAEAVAAAMDVDDLAVLYTGDMSDRFYTLYFSALEACDALPDDS